MSSTKRAWRGVVARPPAAACLGIVDNWEAEHLRGSGRVLRLRPCLSSEVEHLAAGREDGVDGGEYPVEESVGVLAHARGICAGLRAAKASAAARDAGAAPPDAAATDPQRVFVHVYVDSGMGRAGGYYSEPGDLGDFVDAIRAECPELVVAGFMTHLPRADEDGAGTRQSIDAFLSLLAEYLGSGRWARDPRLGDRELLVHYANSPTLVRFNTRLPGLPAPLAERFRIRHIARPGIATYGPIPGFPDEEDPVHTQRDGDEERGRASAITLGGDDERERIRGRERGSEASGGGGVGQKAKLLPVMEWTCNVCSVRKVPRGANVGYGTTTVDRDTLVATLPIGYADGFLRTMGNGRGGGILKGARAPVLGRVMMNMICLDITDHPEAESIGPGCPVELISDNIDGNAVADAAGTIAYEIFLSVGRKAQKN